MISKYSSITRSFTSYIFQSYYLSRKVKPLQVQSKMKSKLKQTNYIVGLAQQQFQPIEPKAEEKDMLKDKKKGNDPPKIKLKQSAMNLVQKGNVHTSISEVKKLEKVLGSLGKILEPLHPKQLKKIAKQQFISIQNSSISKVIQNIKELNLKDFSILVHRLLVNSASTNTTLEKYIWKQLEGNFINRFELTTDTAKIRSYSKLIYCLAKSKIHRNTSSALVNTSLSTNLQSLETKFALLLPSATHQSFTMITTSLSRMGPLSEEFSYIIQRLYYTKYEQFNIRQRIQINYALTRNNRKVDKKLIQYVDSMNLRQILIMLRCYANCNELNQQLLRTAQKNIIPRKNQMNVVDIGDICGIYFQAMSKPSLQYRFSPQLQKVLNEMYEVLKNNMNEVSFEKIWKNLPEVVNRGYLQIQFIEQVIKTLKIMRKKGMFGERIWKPLRQSFQRFENLQLRTRLQQIK